MTNNENENEIIDELERPDYGFGVADYNWDEILPGLWQGGTHDEDDIRSYLYKQDDARVTLDNFDFVATLYSWAKPADWFVREYRYGIYDSTIEQIDLDKLWDLVDLTHKEWKAGSRVLVRCQAGWNRSGLVMALVLIKEGYKAQEAIDLIQRKRSGRPLCNLRFVKWLQSLDETFDLQN